MNVSPPTGHESTREEVYELADAPLCDGLTDNEVQRLERLLCADAEARRHYVSFMHLSAKLCRCNSANTTQPRGPGTGGEVPGGGRAGVAHTTADDDSPAEIIAAGSARPPSPSPFILHPFAWLVGSAVCSYTLAALLLGAGLLAAWAWKAPDRGRRDLAGQLLSPEPAAGQSPQPAGVGRVIALNNCRWADPASAAADGDPVPLGRRYALASGWLQIRYHTGAVVVIYGPAAYQAASATSGFLSQGKAGVWVYETEVQGGIRGEWGRFRVNPNFFAIRTPKAVLYDICGNFSVAVNQLGRTNTRLIEGRIMAVYPRNALAGHTISSIPKAWYFVDRDNPRGFAVIYRNDPKPWGLWPFDDRRFGWSDGTLDLQQWQVQQRNPNARPKPPAPN